MVQQRSLWICSLLAGGMWGGVVVAAAQSEFRTEIRIGVDRNRVEVRRLGRADERRIGEVIQGRLPLFALEGGSVDVRSLDDVRLVVPVTQPATEFQLRALRRPGLLELRHLDEVQTSLNPKARYVLEYRQIVEMVPVKIGEGATARQVARPRETSRIGFRERDSNRPVSVLDVVSRSPLIASTDDILPGSAKVITDGPLAVRVQFRVEATRRLSRFHEKPGRLLGIMLDGEMIGMVGSVPELAGARGKKATPRVVDSLDLPGTFAVPEEAGYLAVVLNSGALPVPITVLATRLIAR